MCHLVPQVRLERQRTGRRGLAADVHGSGAGVVEGAPPRVSRGGLLQRLLEARPPAVEHHGQRLVRQSEVERIAVGGDQLSDVGLGQTRDAATLGFRGVALHGDVRRPEAIAAHPHAGFDL